MCGIVGIVGQSAVNQQLYDALTVLQHRGQDAAGIMTCDEGELFMRKQNGLVRDVFQQRHMLRLKGNIGIGHVRYPTAGCDSSSEAQPFFVNSPYGICLGHNGNLTNAAELAEVLIREDLRHLNTSSDSEVLLNVLASELSRAGTPRASAADIFAAVTSVYRRTRGGFAVVSMIVGHGLLGFRDPHGIRPLVIGRRETPQGDEYMLASESVALDQIGFELLRDVGPGEAVFIDEHGRFYSHQCVPVARHTPCIFEYVYFARPDSIIDNISVHKARLRMGDLLAEKIRRIWPDHDIDVGDPDSRHQPHGGRAGRAAARHQVPRRLRQEPLHRPHVHHAGAGAAREVGALQAQRHRPRVPRQERAADRRFDRARHDLRADHRPRARSRCPPRLLRFRRATGALPNVYGIDMPATSELVAADRTDEEVAKLIGADRLIYQDLDDLVRACLHHDSNIQEFDDSCFSGRYVTGDVTPSYLARLQEERSDEAKARRKQLHRGSLKAIRAV